jgi:hypothetical protein
VSKQNILAKNIILNTYLRKDDQIIVANIKDELQRAAHALKNIATKYNLKISVDNAKAMTMKGKMDVTTKIVTKNHII